MDNRIIEIADHYKDAQFNKAIEELCETSTAISRYITARDVFNTITSKHISDIVTELADAKIMIAQLEYLLCIETQVEKEIDYKLDRQIKRIAGVCTVSADERPAHCGKFGDCSICGKGD